MKKRVHNSEIEHAKKSSHILFLSCFIFFLLLFITFLVLYALDVDVLSYITTSKEKIAPIISSKKDEDIHVEKENSTSYELDPNDTNIQKYFNYVRITGDHVCEDGSYYQDSLLVSKLSSKCKFSLASNLYEDKIKMGLDGLTYILEEDVKESFETLFGVGSYERVESIPVYPKQEYIFRDHYYFSNGSTGEEYDTITSYEKVLKATREGDMLDITSATVYYEKLQAILCRDRNCSDIIETVQSSAEFGDEFFDLYVEHYQDQLYQYTYHFEMDDAGFYHYVGYERTNE